MKLKEYVEKLTEILEQDTDAAEFEVVTTIGYQSFSVIDYVPAVGILSGVNNDWFDPLDDENRDEDVNAVLVN